MVRAIFILIRILAWFIVTCDVTLLILKGLGK